MGLVVAVVESGLELRTSRMQGSGALMLSYRLAAVCSFAEVENLEAGSG